MNRFYYINFGGHEQITDDLTGHQYTKINKELCDLLNDINNRADHNAKLISIDKISLEHKIIKLEEQLKK